MKKVIVQNSHQTNYQTKNFSHLLMNIVECIKREKLYPVFTNSICNEYSPGDKIFFVFETEG